MAIYSKIILLSKHNHSADQSHRARPECTKHYCVKIHPTKGRIIFLTKRFSPSTFVHILTPSDHLQYVGYGDVHHQITNIHRYPSMKDMNDFDLKNNEEELRIVAQSHNEKANIWSIDSASHCTPKLMFSSEIRH